VLECAECGRPSELGADGWRALWTIHGATAIGTPPQLDDRCRRRSSSKNGSLHYESGVVRELRFLSCLTLRRFW
jgi:hypothetical protein